MCIQSEMMMAMVEVAVDIGAVEISRMRMRSSWRSYQVCHVVQSLLRDAGVNWFPSFMGGCISAGSAVNDRAVRLATAGC